MKGGRYWLRRYWWIVPVVLSGWCFTGLVLLTGFTVWRWIIYPVTHPRETVAPPGKVRFHPEWEGPPLPEVLPRPKPEAEP